MVMFCALCRKHWWRRRDVVGAWRVTGWEEVCTGSRSLTTVVRWTLSSSLTFTAVHTHQRASSCYGRRPSNSASYKSTQVTGKRSCLISTLNFVAAEVHPVHAMNPAQRQMAADLLPKPIGLSYRPACPCRLPINYTHQTLVTICCWNLCILFWFSILHYLYVIVKIHYSTTVLYLPRPIRLLLVASVK